MKEQLQAYVKASTAFDVARMNFLETERLLHAAKDFLEVCHDKALKAVEEKGEAIYSIDGQAVVVSWNESYNTLEIDVREVIEP